MVGCVSLQGKEKTSLALSMCTQGRGHGSTQQAGGHLQPKRRDISMKPTLLAPRS